MISRIQALNYRCLRYVDLTLGHFHVLIGPNASGKSTFLDVVAFLGELLKHGPEQAVRNRAQTLPELVWKRQGQEFELAVEMRVPASVRPKNSQNGKQFDQCRYEVKVGVDPKEGIRLLAENFFILAKTEGPEREGASTQSEFPSFPAEPEPPPSFVKEARARLPAGWRKVVSRREAGGGYFRSEATDWNFPQRPGAQKAALAIVPEEERFPISNWAKRVLTEGVQVLALNSRAMREPCRPDVPLAFRPDGSNLPVALRHLQESDASRFQRWLAHVQTILPQLQSIEVRERPVDRFPHLVAKYDNGIEVPSWLLSDGTLRLLALTLLAYLPSEGQVYLIEEPENGIHPRALEAVYQSLSSVYDGQVLCATHSPLFLSLAKLSDLVCFAQASSGATAIVKGPDHPALKKWKGQVSLDTLYAAGVLG